MEPLWKIISEFPRPFQQRDDCTNRANDLAINLLRVEPGEEKRGRLGSKGGRGTGQNSERLETHVVLRMNE